MNKTGIKYVRENIRAIVERYRETGITLIELKDELKVSSFLMRSEIVKIVGEAEWQRLKTKRFWAGANKKRISSEKLANIAADYKEGMIHYKIKQKYHCADCTIEKARKLHGIPKRPTGKKHITHKVGELDSITAEQIEEFEVGIEEAKGPTVTVFGCVGCGTDFDTKPEVACWKCGGIRFEQYQRMVIGIDAFV